ncbi:hypothetical protein FXF51_30860 [Nonomuraea sp. PA05]|uniref:hypothetical protein n=1 Tax=Nonomuraea sp. PA05 TaxID=2604466 RepID=UPI0011DAC70A|nr:hypothetical protein [Nonomuraea sp. PA05]TYB60621.1 hypothetical protein FXF51_30860 [Nonomuraea sp. PA05]
MFFESVRTEEINPRLADIELPAWLGPPVTEMGTLLPMERLLARSDNVVLNLAFVRAYRAGCSFQVEIAFRQGDLHGGDFLELHMMAMYATPRFTLRAGEPLPDRLLRWGVRFSNGTKLTSIDDRSGEPSAPLLQAMHQGGGETGSMLGGTRLWLWPLPPPEPFELAVEWPMGGIGLTIVELDGAAIVAAGRRSTDFWP